MLSNPFRGFWEREKGAALVETAISLPILLLLIAGFFEIGMYILLNSKLTRMAGVITDAITRQNISTTTLLGIMGSGNNILNPFNFNANGQMVVSQVHNTSANSDPTKMLISWQQVLNKGISKIGLPGGIPKNLPGNVSVINNQTMIVTEVFYSYKPLVFSRYFSPKTLYVTAVFVPRSGDMTTLLAG